MSDEFKFKKGEMVILTSGEYSDYGWEKLAEVQVDFDLSEFSTGPTAPREVVDELFKTGLLKHLRATELCIDDRSGSKVPFYVQRPEFP